MVNDTNFAVDRVTWVLDPGPGNFLTRDNLIAHAANYAAYFTTQFIWYAPMTRVHPDPSSYWSACFPPKSRPLLTFCANVDLHPQKTIGRDLTQDDTLDAIAYRSDWIALACGNFHLPVAGSSPAPVIRGFKFDDANRNRVQDGGEGGLGGITFTLSRVASLVGQGSAADLATATSDDAGNFSFTLNRDDEGPGTYVVTEEFNSNWPNTTPLAEQIFVPEGAGDGENLPTLVFGDRQEIPPVPVAVPEQADQSDLQGAKIELDGSRSYSPTGDAITYSWSGPFGTATGATPTVEMPPGTHDVTLTVSDGIQSQATSVPITVFPPITAHPVAVAATEGAAFRGPVGTFTDPDSNGVASDYNATINWGDGTAPTPGTITKNPTGDFSVAGQHTFVEEGSYSPQVTVTDDDVAFNTAAAKDAATVDDAALAATGGNTATTNPLSNYQVATFSDHNPFATKADFTASIDWGDGTVTAGTVDGPAGGPFTVTGSHTYTSLGFKTIKVHVIDDGGQTADAQDQVLLYAPSGFVVGDQTVGPVTPGMIPASPNVTFWGAQWWKENSLSGGAAPAAFKGYQNSVRTAAPGGIWTTSPGNSSSPPHTVPSYMSVIVTSHVTQAGSTITGDVVHVVIVETAAGYAPNPGHEGTGKAVWDLS